MLGGWQWRLVNTWLYCLFAVASTDGTKQGNQYIEWDGTFQWPGYDIALDSDAFFYEPLDAQMDLSLDPAELFTRRLDAVQGWWESAEEEERKQVAGRPSVFWRQTTKQVVPPLGPWMGGVFPPQLAGLAYLGTGVPGLPERAELDLSLVSVPSADSPTRKRRKMELEKSFSSSIAEAGSDWGQDLSVEAPAPLSARDLELNRRYRSGITSEEIRVAMEAKGEPTVRVPALPGDDEMEMVVSRVGLLFQGFYLGGALSAAMVNLRDEVLRREVRRSIEDHRFRLRVLKERIKVPGKSTMAIMAGDKCFRQREKRLQQSEALAHLWDTVAEVDSLAPNFSERKEDGTLSTIGDVSLGESTIKFDHPLFTSSLRGTSVTSMDLAESPPRRKVVPTSVEIITDGLRRLSMGPVSDQLLAYWRVEEDKRLEVLMQKDSLLIQDPEEDQIPARRIALLKKIDQTERRVAVLKAGLPNPVVRARLYNMEKRAHLDAATDEEFEAELQELGKEMAPLDIPVFQSFRLFWEASGLSRQAQRTLEGATWAINIEHEALSAVYEGLTGEAAAGSIYALLRQQKIPFSANWLVRAGLDSEAMDDLDKSLSLLHDSFQLGESLARGLSEQDRVTFNTVVTRRLEQLRHERHLAVVAAHQPRVRRFWEEENRWIHKEIDSLRGSAEVDLFAGGFSLNNIVDWELPIPLPEEVIAMGKDAYYKEYIEEVEQFIDEDHSVEEEDLPHRYFYRGVRFPRPAWEWNRVSLSAKTITEAILAGPTDVLKPSLVEVRWLRYAVSISSKPIAMLGTLVAALWELGEEQQREQVRKGWRHARVTLANRVAGAKRRYDAGNLWSAEAAQQMKEAEDMLEYRAAGENELLYHAFNSVTGEIGLHPGQEMTDLYRKMAARGCKAKGTRILAKSLVEVEEIPRVSEGERHFLELLFGEPTEDDKGQPDVRLSSFGFYEAWDPVMRVWLMNLRKELVKAGAWSEVVPEEPKGSTRAGLKPYVEPSLPDRLQRDVDALVKDIEHPHYRRLLLQGLEDVENLKGEFENFYQREQWKLEEEEETLKRMSSLGASTSILDLEQFSRQQLIEEGREKLRDRKRLAQSWYSRRRDPLDEEEAFDDWCWRMINFHANGKEGKMPAVPANVPLLKSSYVHTILCCRRRRDWVRHLFDERPDFGNPESLRPIFGEMKQTARKMGFAQRRPGEPVEARPSTSDRGDDDNGGGGGVGMTPQPGTSEERSTGGTPPDQGVGPMEGTESSGGGGGPPDEELMVPAAPAAPGSGARMPDGYVVAHHTNRPGVFMCTACVTYYESIEDIVRHARVKHRLSGQVCPEERCHRHFGGEAAMVVHARDHQKGVIIQTAIVRNAPTRRIVIASPLATPRGTPGSDPLGDTPSPVFGVRAEEPGESPQRDAPFGQLTQFDLGTRLPTDRPARGRAALPGAARRVTQPVRPGEEGRAASPPPIQRRVRPPTPGTGLSAADTSKEEAFREDVEEEEPEEDIPEETPPESPEEEVQRWPQVVPDRTFTYDATANRWVCDVCHHTYKRRDSWNRHTCRPIGTKSLGKGGSRRAECPVCEGQFSRSDTMRDHCRRAHGCEPDDPALPKRKPVRQGTAPRLSQAQMKKMVAEQEKQARGIVRAQRVAKSLAEDVISMMGHIERDTSPPVHPIRRRRPPSPLGDLPPMSPSGDSPPAARVASEEEPSQARPRKKSKSPQRRGKGKE